MERPPWLEANVSGKTWQCNSKDIFIEFFSWREATPLERPHFLCRWVGLTWGIPLYCLEADIKAVWLQQFNVNISSNLGQLCYCSNKWLLPFPLMKYQQAVIGSHESRATYADFLLDMQLRSNPISLLNLSKLHLALCVHVCH